MDGGFRVPPTGAPETDGLIGSAVLAAALDRVAGAPVVCVVEPDVAPALAAAMRGAGLAVAREISGLPHVVTVLDWPGSAADARSVADLVAPSACVAITKRIATTLLHSNRQPLKNRRMECEFRFPLALSERSSRRARRWP